MKQYADQAIILGRIDYGEKDRILTLLTRSNGKISVLAKSVRSQKSRLAGGIELLSTSEVSFVKGRGGLYTLTGARLERHYEQITTDMQRMNRAFEALWIVSKLSDDGSGQEYYVMLEQLFEFLNDGDNDVRLAWIWFVLHVLDVHGTLPTIVAENDSSSHYEYDFDTHAFIKRDDGAFALNDLKLLKLSATQPRPLRLQKACGSEDQLEGFVNLLLKTSLTEV